MKHTISDIVNDEQLLDLALTNIAEHDSDDVHPIAYRVAFAYLGIQYQKQGLDPAEVSDDKFHDDLSELIVEKAMEGLVQKGLVEVNVGEEITYKVTEEGRNKINGY